MSVFSTNQNRQMYVALAKKTASEIKESTTPGDIAAVGINNNQELYFNYVGADKTLMRSDLINVDSIMYAKATDAENIKLKLKSVKVSLKRSTPVLGQDYILRINIQQAFGKGDDTTYQKFGAVRVNSEITDEEKFWAAMAKSLERNFSEELTKWFTFTPAADGLTITEVEQDWVAGKTPKENVHFSIANCMIYVAGIEEEAFATTNNGKTVGTVTYTPEEKNGHIIVDQEIFYMGERGDQYRDTNGLIKINTQYLADPTKDYCTIDIHYAFVDSNEGVQKSEKDIYIVGEKATINAVIADINSIKAGLLTAL